VHRGGEEIPLFRGVVRAEEKTLRLEPLEKKCHSFSGYSKARSLRGRFDAWKETSGKRNREGCEFGGEGETAASGYREKGEGSLLVVGKVTWRRESRLAGSTRKNARIFVFPSGEGGEWWKSSCKGERGETPSHQNGFVSVKKTPKQNKGILGIRVPANSPEGSLVTKSLSTLRTGHPGWAWGGGEFIKNWGASWRPPKEAFCKLRRNL